MKFGDFIRNCRQGLIGLGLAALAGAAVLGAPQQALAAADAAAKDSAAAAPAAAAPAAAGDRFAVAPGGYTPMKPQAGKGMPVDAGVGFQDQYSDNGKQALWIHNSILLPIVFGTAGFVGVLLLIVMVRFNKRANPVPSKTSHNTLLEIVWTGIPVLILAFVAIYSLDLIAKQYKPAPKNAITIKATGNQWYWTYSYPDNGGFEVTSNILKDADADARGEPRQLAADYRMVVPAGEPIRLQTFGADVIHSFAVPSLWFKLDAVPGKINERQLVIKEPGVYYGQCSELCGARHGYMPIVVEALDRPHFNAWVMTHSGGKIDGAPEAPKAAPAAADAAKPAEPAKAAEAAPAAKPA
ncbi:MAG: cytochrome c oxidase subunit II [Proteobacteria bacterium]|nr:cytochrome c oxidase subunit II [Pseudomonadota bacterium]